MSRAVWILIFLCWFVGFPTFVWAFVYHPLWACLPLLIMAGFLVAGARLDRS